MNELPPGWAETTIGEIGDYLNGRGFKKSEWSPNGRPIIRIQNLTGSGLAHNYYAGEAEESHVARDGDLLISWAATLGVYVWRGPEAVINQHIFKVTSFIDSGFHRYLVQSLLGALGRETHGSGMVHITRGRFESLAVPLPPLAEQRRIVAAIEEQFSRLDAAEATLHAAHRRIARLRDAAFETPVAHTPLRRLVDLLRDPLRNGHSAKGSRNGMGVRTLTLTAVTRDQFVEANTKLTVADPDRVTHLWLEPGDVLIERSNTPELVGTAAMYDGPPDWAIFPDLLIRVRTNDELLPAYLESMLRSRRARSYFQERAQGIAGSMPKIDQRAVEEFELPLPSLAEQRRIVAKLEQQLSLIDSLRAAVESAQKRSAVLRRAVLERAFRGELVPQDPADEPASVLLERIRAERAAELSPRRRRAVRSSR